MPVIDKEINKNDLSDGGISNPEGCLVIEQPLGTVLHTQTFTGFPITILTADIGIAGIFYFTVQLDFEYDSYPCGSTMKFEENIS